MKKIIAVLLVLFVIIVASNLFSLSLGESFHYQTENKEFEFDLMPSKGRTLDMMERNFSEFKSKNSNLENAKLFRTFKKNPLKFWNWWSYISNPIFKYEYRKA